MPADGESIDLETVYSVLEDPIKRKIIVLLAEKGPLRYRDLQKELGISAGSFYYNMNALRSQGYILQDESRKYSLTEKGAALYKALKEGGEVIRQVFTSRKRIINLLDKYLVSLIIPIQLTLVFHKNSLMSILVLVACITSGLTVTLATKLSLKVIEVEPIPLQQPKSFGVVTLQPNILLALSYAVSLTLCALMIYLVARILTGRRPPLLSLFAGIASSQVPLQAYMVIQYLLTNTSYPNIPEQTFIMLAVTLRILQIFVLGLLTATVAVCYDTSRERGFLAASIVLYASFFLRYFLP
ncbi:MAG: winged helix-turn-helix transcriptional regulator [Thermofilaceae archaeon]